MDSAILEGAWQKLHWGTKHLSTLIESIHTALQSEENHAVLERESETRYALKVWYGEWPVEEWSLILGDAVQSLRSALDHAVWEIVERRGTLPTDDRELRRIQFPIYDSSQGFENAVVVGLVDAGTRTILESAQPYKGRKVLSYLAALSNDDKHRLLLPSLVAYAKGQFNFRVASNEDIAEVGELILTIKAGEPIEAGAKIGYLDAEVVGPDPQMHVEGDFPGLVAFKAQGGVIIGFASLPKLAVFVKLILQSLQLNSQGFPPT